MNDANSNTEMNKALFLQLITMLAISAMQQMGKIINPLTGKAEVSLEAAQATIDLLDMLEVKTRGNRDKDEEKTLKDALSSLKLTYIETAEMAEKAPKEQKPPEGQKPETPPAASSDATSKPGEGGPKADEKAPPKFHKSYE